MRSRITRTLALTGAWLGLARGAAAQTEDDVTIDPRTLARIAAELEASSEIARTSIDADGNLWVEPARTRTQAELEGLRLMDTPEGRDALRAWFAGGRPPSLTDDDRLLLDLLARRDFRTIAGVFGWDGRSLLNWQAGAQTWADEVLPKAPPAFDPAASGQSPTDYAPEAVTYRYACCDDLTVRANASAQAPSVGELSRGEAVVVVGLAAAGLPGLAEDLEECLPDDCEDLASLIQENGVNVYARVQSTQQIQVKGWVPLISLFASPRVEKADRLALQLGYNRAIAVLDDVVKGIFWPDACGEVTKQVEQTNDAFADEDHLWDPDAGKLTFCDTLLGNADPADDGECAACRPIAAQVFGPGGTFDADLLDAHPDLAAAYAAECRHYLAPGEVKTVIRRDAYQCGEYPFGATHYGDVVQVEDKSVHTWQQWDRFHRVRMGRWLDQKPVAFQQFDMATGQVEQFATSGFIDSRNLWFAFTPIHEPAMQGGKIPPDYDPIEEHKLLVHACGRLPGTFVQGPNVDYHWKNTAKQAFNKIAYGRLDFDRLDFCALGKFSLDADMQPSLTWTEVTQFSLVGADISGLEVTFAAWVYLAGAATLGLLAILGGWAGSVIAGVLSTVLVAAVTLPLYLNLSENDELVVEDLLPETLKIKLIDRVLVQLNDATADGVARMSTEAMDRLDELCETGLPAVEETHPLHYFYAYLRAECEAIVLNGRWVPFAAHAQSLADGCYGTDRFFSPALVGQTAAHAFSGFEGQAWFTGAGDDAGCRLEFLRYGKVDARLWPALKCLAAQANLHFNQGEWAPASWNGFGQLATEACGDEGLAALQALYGTGADLLPLMGDGGGLGYLGN